MIQTIIFSCFVHDVCLRRRWCIKRFKVRVPLTVFKIKFLIFSYSLTEIYSSSKITVFTPYIMIKTQIMKKKKIRVRIRVILLYSELAPTMTHDVICSRLWRRKRMRRKCQENFLLNLAYWNQSINFKNW